jgi:DNA-binding transcriptional LysR family regulator
VRLNGIASARLLDDPFVLLAPPGSPQPLSPDFSVRPLLACKPCEAQREHESALQLSHGLPQGGVVWLDDALTIQSLVAAGCAYGLLPSLAVTSADLAIESLEGPRREIDLVWQRERTATEALRQFVEAAQQACSSVDGWSDGSGTGETRTAA